MLYASLAAFFHEKSLICMNWTFVDSTNVRGIRLTNCVAKPC